jgi:hypothetical protein
MPRSLAATKYLFAVFLVAPWGCGSKETVDDTDVKKDKIYQHYRADYNAKDKNLSLFAQFNLGGITGTTIRLTSPSAVTVDGQAMRLTDGESNSVNLIGTYYTLNSSVAAPNDSYAFKWTGNDGTTRNNTLTIAKSAIVNSPASGAEISKSSDLVMTFEGGEIQPGETIFFHVTSDSIAPQGQSSTRSQSITSGKQAIISHSDFANFVNGPAKINVRRLREEDTTSHEGVGGVLFSYYTSESITVNVKD